MSNQVEVTRRVKFTDNLDLMLQQKQPKIYGKITQSVDVSGSKKTRISDIFGAVSTRRNETRHSDTEYVNTPHEAVWIAKPPEDYVADLVDRSDVQQTSIEIGSGYMMTQRAAIHRYWDDQALTALYADMITGEEGTTLTPLPGSATVAVTIGGSSGNQGMNLEKLEEATQYLLDNDNDLDEEEKFIVLSPRQCRELLREVPATNSDYVAATGARFDPKTGYHTFIKGWNIITMNMKSSLLRSAALSVDGSGFRKNPFWVASGLCKGEWDRLFASSDRLPGKRHSMQYYAASCVNVTRTQTGKTGIILNSEA